MWRYGYGRYDEAAKKVADFKPLPHFTGMAWQGGPKLPDPKLGWVMLTAEGADDKVVDMLLPEAFYR